MDCATAAPFVSMLCDGDAVPDDAARHIASCTACQAALRDWTDAAGRLRLLAAADRLAPLPPLALSEGAALPPARPVWRAWTSPMRVPRFAAAIAVAAIVVSSIGWFRAETAGRVLMEMAYELTIACPSGGGFVTSTSGGTAYVGTRMQFATSDPCGTGGRGLVGLVEAISVRDGVVRLRLGVSPTDAAVSASPRVDPADVREYDYVSGQVIDLSVPGGPTMTFKGTVRLRRAAATAAAPETMDALLPKDGELAITMPALLRDGATVVVTMNAGTTVSGNDVIGLYAPGTGLFLFSLDRFDGALEAQAGGATLMFEAGGHRYQLYSSLPLTNGPQPRTLWVRMLAGYRPSARGGQDDLPGLLTGSPGSFIR
jgi:hypothetical protein